MNQSDEYNRRTIEEFRANGGKVEGHTHLLLLTHTGARSGKRRTTPMGYTPVSRPAAGADAAPTSGDRALPTKRLTMQERRFSCQSLGIQQPWSNFIPPISCIGARKQSKPDLAARWPPTTSIPGCHSRGKVPSPGRGWALWAWRPRSSPLDQASPASPTATIQRSSRRRPPPLPPCTLAVSG